MPLPFILGASLALQGAAGVGQIIKGIGQDNEAERLRNTPRPQYSIQNEYYDNVDIASYLAQQGLTQESKNYYDNAANRGLSRATDVSLQTGGGINSFANIYDTYLQGQYKVAAEDSQLQTQNYQNLIQQNLNLAGQETMKWSINELEPYKDRMKAAAAAADASAKNIFGGINSVIGAGATAATALSQEKNANPNIASINNGNVLVAPPNYQQTKIDVSSGVPVQTQDTADRLTTPVGYGQQSIAPSGVSPIETQDTNAADYAITQMLKKLQTNRSLTTNFRNVA